MHTLVGAMTLDLGDPPAPQPHAHFVFKWLGSFLSNLMSRLGNLDAKVGEILRSPCLQWVGKRKFAP